VYIGLLALKSTEKRGYNHDRKFNVGHTIQYDAFDVRQKKQTSSRLDLSHGTTTEKNNRIELKAKSVEHGGFGQSLGP